MNRSHRLKSGMGKARSSHERRRNDQLHHQLLIADFLSDQDTDGHDPVVHGTVDTPMPARVPATTVRVIEPTAYVGPGAGRRFPAIVTPRTPGANPAIVGTAMHVESRRPGFRWRALLTGFLVTAIPGLGLLLLLSFFIR